MLAALVLAATAAATPFDEVVAAERAFAADSPVLGLHPAFLAHLAPDAVVFQPLPTPGIAAHEGKPPSKGLLSWGPAWVAASASGDLALSTGPYAFRVPGDGGAPSTGWFFSIWKKQPDGAFKVRADFGVSCALSYAPPPTVENGRPDRDRVPAAMPAKDLAKALALVRAEEARLDRAAKEGIGPAVLARADPGLRAYRDGACPAVGIDAARALLAHDTRRLACAPERIELAGSGDLGFAYGACERTEGLPGKTGYLRVFARQDDGGFKVLVDIVAPVPEAK